MLPFFLLLIFIPGCQHKPSEKDIEKNLSGAMEKYLNSNPTSDFSKATFNVTDVIYFEEKTFYRCEFKIHLVSPKKDTTGVMTADVSKDFERVIRKS